MLVQDFLDAFGQRLDNLRGCLRICASFLQEVQCPSQVRDVFLRSLDDLRVTFEHDEGFLQSMASMVLMAS